MSTNDNSGKSAKKRKMTSRIKWTDKMEQEIFEFAKPSLVDGRGFEKPTANDFYRRFLSTSNPDNFQNVTLEKLVQHMKAIKNAYHIAINWRNQTGEGILASDPTAAETIQGEIMKRCKQFYEIDEILGDRPQFNPPYVYHSDFEIEMDEIGLPDVSSGDLTDSTNNVNSAQTDTQNPITVEGSAEIPLVDIEIPVADAENSILNVTKTPTTSTVLSRSLRKKYRNSPIRSTMGALESAMKMRAEADQKRLDWETKCKQQELEEKKEERMSQTSLQLARLEFEKQKWEDEKKNKEIEAARKFELEKIKIEKETELAREKAKQEFELEKLRLTMGK